MTPRDVEWLRWVGRWRGVTAHQIAAWFLPDAVAGHKSVERRARDWREEGLISSKLWLPDYPSFYTLTRAGMRIAGQSGPVREVIEGQLRHDTAVVDAAIWYCGENPCRLFTEREIRAVDPAGSTAPRMAVLGHPDSGKKIIYPDFVTATENIVNVHEVERSPKEHKRLLGLMLSYGRDPKIHAVTYYVRHELFLRTDRAASEANAKMRVLWGAPEKITVTTWEWDNE